MRSRSLISEAAGARSSDKKRRHEGNQVSAAMSLRGGRGAGAVGAANCETRMKLRFPSISLSSRFRFHRRREAAMVGFQEGLRDQ